MGMEIILIVRDTAEDEGMGGGEAEEQRQAAGFVSGAGEKQ